EAHLAVPPVIQQQLPRFRVCAAVFELIELKDGHQLQAIDTQLLEVGDFLANGGEGAWVLGARGRVAREAAHVRFVDDEVLDRYFQGTVGAPVEIIKDDAAPVLVYVVPVRLPSPDIATTYNFGVRIQENFGRIKPMPLPRVIGALHTEAVF